MTTRHLTDHEITEIRAQAAQLPRAPVSAATHGDPRLWTELYEWAPFERWARALPKQKTLERTRAPRTKEAKQ